MARQFGTFLLGFLDYDTKMVLTSMKRFMKIRYEKLSMFCFIYGKLGHGGEFLPAAGNGGAICNTPYPFPSPE
ncbi:hypothetical protein Godav_005774 [Gossypium davidsonii]|uniref:Uncharacterized protein n=1 Tax=Gossypium davidsonii TaxID=34287 RepID=A0A7J8S330_GOSDV|nr:hypothetical protein [Gossypium davidsonii]